MHARKLPRISEPSFDKNYNSNSGSNSGHYEDSYRSSKSSKYVSRRSSISPDHNLRRDRETIESSLNSPYRDRSPINNYRHSRHNSNRDRRDRSRRERHYNKFRKDNNHASSSFHRTNDPTDRRTSPSNRRTQVTRHPESNVSKQTTLTTSSTSTTTTTTSSSSSTSALRSVGDWSEHVSSSGKEYYYNCVTEVSQWEKPREWLEFEHQQHRLRSSYNNEVTANVHDDNNASVCDNNNAGSSAQNHNHQHSQQQLQHHHLHSQQHQQQQPKLTGGNSRQMGTSERYVRSDSTLSSRLGRGSSRDRENRKRRNNIAGNRNRTHLERQSATTSYLPMTTTITTTTTSMMATSSSSSASSPSSTSQGATPSQLSIENDDKRVNDEHSTTSITVTSLSSTSLPPSSQTTASTTPSTTVTTTSTSLSNASGAANVSDALRTIHSALMGLNHQHQMTAANSRQNSHMTGHMSATDQSSHSDTTHTPNQALSASNVPHVASHEASKPATSLTPSSSTPTLTASLARLYKESLVSHVVGWPAEGIERMAQRRNEEHSSNLHLNVARVSAELKMARSLVRLAEIQATLQEQRILFLRQQSVDLEALRTGCNTKIREEISAIGPNNQTVHQSTPSDCAGHDISRHAVHTVHSTAEVHTLQTGT